MPADGPPTPNTAPRCCSAGLLVLAVVYLAAWLPVVGVGTDNPQILAARINDEPPIVQQMLGMAQRPYGDPSNYLRRPDRLPPEWGEIVFPDYIYYGGAYPGLGFLAYLPCRLLGAADFPVAPIALRVVSVLSGLVALILAYRLGRRLGGETGGFLTGLLLVTDSIFTSYCTIIHPDSTMLAFGLGALTVAIAHAEHGGVKRLALLGLLDGFVHGAKMGGPWTVFFSVAAAWWGWKHDYPPGSERRWVSALGRSALLGVSAAAGFVISTPYVLLNRYYVSMIRNNYNFFRSSPWTPASIADWLHVFSEHLGVLAPIVAAVVFVSVVLAIRHAELRKPIALTLILAASIVAWYMVFIRLWATAHYLLPAFALLHVLVGGLIGRGIAAFAASGVRSRVAGTAVAAAIVLGIVGIRGGWMAYVLAERYSAYQATPIAINAWAKDHLPHNAKIISDDLAYFDRGLFPHAKLHGGLLNYRTLEQKKPDYFVISSSIYDADHYVGLRKEQRLPRDSKEEFSVRLYQDLLDNDDMPDAELVHVLEPTPRPLSRLGLWKAALCSLLGREEIIAGPQLRIYRYRARESAASLDASTTNSER